MRQKKTNSESHLHQCVRVVASVLVNKSTKIFVGADILRKFSPVIFNKTSLAKKMEKNYYFRKFK